VFEEDVMQTFAIGPGRWRLARAVGRNPLVRGSDRLEALTVVLAIVAVIVAAAIAGAVGTAVHDSRSRIYLEQASTRHAVTATAIQDSTVPVGPSSNPTTTVRAHWWAAGVEHVATVRSHRAARAGQQLTIWVDNAGDYTSAPAPASQAAVDAIGVAILLWLAVATVAGTATVLLRQGLNRFRFLQWENQFRDLVENGGQRRSQP
jgi:hypothetical protein